jgi:hypothetical protein
MKAVVTWETWSAAEARWKAEHPIPHLGRGWRKRMLAEISEQLGGAQRPSPPVGDDSPDYESICQGCGTTICDSAASVEFNTDAVNPDGSRQVDTGGPVGQDGLQADILNPDTDYYELCGECAACHSGGRA